MKHKTTTFIFLFLLSISFAVADFGYKDNSKPILEAPTSNLVISINESTFNVNNSDLLDGTDWDEHINGTSNNLCVFDGGFGQTGVNKVKSVSGFTLYDNIFAGLNTQFQLYSLTGGSLGDPGANGYMTELGEGKIKLLYYGLPNSGPPIHGYYNGWDIYTNSSNDLIIDNENTYYPDTNIYTNAIKLYGNNFSGDCFEFQNGTQCKSADKYGYLTYSDTIAYSETSGYSGSSDYCLYSEEAGYAPTNAGVALTTTANTFTGKQTINGDINVTGNVTLFGNHDTVNNKTLHKLQIGSPSSSSYYRGYPTETSGVMYPMINLSIGYTDSTSNGMGLKCILTDSAYKPFRCGWGMLPDITYYGHVLDIAGRMGVEGYGWSGNGAAFFDWSSSEDSLVLYTGNAPDLKLTSWRNGKVWNNLWIEGSSGKIGVNWNGTNSFNIPPEQFSVNGTIYATDMFRLKTNYTAFSCNSTSAGAIYWNNDTKKHYGCNSTDWEPLYRPGKTTSLLLNKSTGGTCSLNFTGGILTTDSTC